MNNTSACCANFYQLPIIHFLLGESFHPGGLKLTKQLAQKTLINRDSLVLDVASGRGATSLFLTEHYGCNVVAVDLSQENLAITQNKALEQQEALNLKTPKLQTVNASADNLPFADNHFDVILCECALCTFENPEQTLREMRRVLKPNGYLGVSDVYLNMPLPENLKSLLVKAFCISGALSVEEYQLLLAYAGFNSIKTQQVDWAITEIIKQIQKQAKFLQTLTNKDELLTPDWLEAEAPQLKAIEKFIELGGLGYLLMIAKK